MTDPVPELAAEITAPTEEPAVTTRVAIIIAVETTGDRRVQLDIAADAWINRVQDTALAVGDRVSVLQQGPVMLVIGRLTGPDAFTPLGAVMPFAGASAPTGWLLADGSAVSRATYAGLFAVCGTTYGAGNGSTTFNLPNLTNRVPVAAGGSYSRGATGGASTVTISEAQMPSHNHSFSGSGGSTGGAGDHGHSISGGTDSGGDHSHSVGNQGGRSDLLAGGGTSSATSGGGSTGGGGGHSHGISGSIGSGGNHSHSVSVSGSIGSAGSDNAHENMPPYIGLTFIIRAL